MSRIKQSMLSVDTAGSQHIYHVSVKLYNDMVLYIDNSLISLKLWQACCFIKCSLKSLCNPDQFNDFLFIAW